MYGNGKHLYAEWFNHGQENALVHVGAAATAGSFGLRLGKACMWLTCVHLGVVTAAATNPIWVVKTCESALATSAAFPPASDPLTFADPSAVMQLQQQERGHTSHTSTASSALPKRSAIPLPTPPAAPSPHFGHSFRSLTSPPTALPSAPHRPTSYSTVVAIFKRDGIRGFYRGLSASLLGVTEGTIQWGLYEQFKLLARQGLREGDDGGWRQSAAAGGAKLIATMITYPHEVRPAFMPLKTCALTIVNAHFRSSGHDYDSRWRPANRQSTTDSPRASSSSSGKRASRRCTAACRPTSSASFPTRSVCSTCTSRFSRGAATLSRRSSRSEGIRRSALWCILPCPHLCTIYPLLSSPPLSRNVIHPSQAELFARCWSDRRDAASQLEDYNHLGAQCRMMRRMKDMV